MGVGEWVGWVVWGESFVKFSLLYFIKNSLLNWSGTSSRKIYKRIPCNFDLCSFYKEFSWDFFFTWKSFVKFFRIFKLESDFFPHFFCKIRKKSDSKFENPEKIYKGFPRKKNITWESFVKWTQIKITWNSFVNFSAGGPWSI